MDIEVVILKEYQDASYNPRKDLKPGDPEYQKLTRSIDEFGFLEPLVVNKRTKHIISGHQRAKILSKRGILDIEAVVVDFSLEKEKAANIALNKIKGEWDDRKLSVLLEELGKLPDFDISVTGFNPPEISHFLDIFREALSDNFDFEEAVGVIEDPVTKKGDIIALGNHCVLCGDSSSLDDINLLLGDRRVNLLNTDFPYNVDYYGGNRPHANGRPKQSRHWERIYSDNMPQDEYEAWMRKVLGNIKGYLNPGSAVYIWQGHRQIPPMYQILIELGFHISSIVCWLKESAAISYGDYSFRTEHALYGWLKGAPHYFAGKFGENNVWEVKRDATSKYIHATQKPVELAQRAIRNSSQRGDLVFDVFLGSGSTLIAAESLERKCFGLELDPKYCDAIVKRYISYVGKDKVSDEIKAKYLKEG
ncbi:MAG: DNA methyltransferase [Candidatus Gygaella obscura]|nr:DNA methyltransferase [Candidatus Gygaella obscura]